MIGPSEKLSFNQQLIEQWTIIGLEAPFIIRTEYNALSMFSYFDDLTLASHTEVPVTPNKIF